MTITRGQKWFVAIALAINVIVWIVPSNVAEQVARDRQTLLGRYSREHFAWIIALIPITAISVWIHLSPNNQVKKKKAFKLVAALMAIVPVLLAFDVYLRLTIDWGYEMGELAYHRTPDRRIEGVFEDKPAAYRTYPNAPPGFGRVEYVMTIDRRGFRNLETLDDCQVLALGDSFTEGSRVSDEEAWPRRFSTLSGAKVYSLGISGYAPQHMLAAFREYGVSLEPQYVFLSIYEGNDFRSAKPLKKAPAEWTRIFKRSPLREALDEFLIQSLGPIGAKRDLSELDILSWQPIAYPSGDSARHYAFPPSFLEHHYESREDFESGKHWSRFREIIEEILQVTRDSGAELVLIYGPTKPRVVMPLVRDTLPADKVRAFTNIRGKVELPPADEFLGRMFEYLDAKEDVTRQWCQKNGVAFVSLTEPLRDAVREGRQPFYTYDEHWSPIGHEVAARTLDAFFRNQPVPTTQESSP